jgi:protoporphyrinogen oxidase
VSNGSSSVGIVGGGILGMTAALRLLQAGHDVTLFERANDLGGLVGSFDFEGRPADRFYHVILPTDDRVRGLAEELGLGDTFRFRPTGVGFYDDGRLFSMSSIKEFLTFPLLSVVGRARLAAFVAWCQVKSNYSDLEDVPLDKWLRKFCGRATVERLWNPLLDSKFDGDYEGLPATYMWARTRRMQSTRDSAGREVMGWLEGGYQRLIDVLEGRIRELGGEIRAGVAVERIVGTRNAVTGVSVDGRFLPFDHVLCTLMPPQASMLLPEELKAHAGVDRFKYMGVICVLIRAKRSVSPYYTLNITDRRIPLTTVVETTHVVDPEYAGGHLLYACKYVDPDHPDLSRPSEDVQRDYLGYVRTMFPDLRDDEIDAIRVQRARMVEPVHQLGGAARIPDMFPVPGLALASTAHVYPEIVNGQAVIGVANRVLSGLFERLTSRSEVRAA